MNRVLKFAGMVEEKAKALPPERVAEHNTTLNIGLDEYIAFQNAQAEAHAGGKLTLEEAQTVYQTLGGSPDHFNAQPFHLKYAVTQTVQELLGAKLGMAGAR